MLIDSHAHILYEDKLDSSSIIKNMNEDGLEAIITIGTNLRDSNEAVSVAKKNKNIYAIVGIHPESVDEFSDNTIAELANLAKHEKVVAIGEIGLDYHFVSDNKMKQQDMFKKQLDLAVSLDLPVCIHSRDAARDMYEILAEYAPRLRRKGVMHCYGDGADYAQKYINLGFYISFAGNVTFKNYDRSFISLIPKDKILVETDCPFLAPEPFRGRINEPKYVNYTASFLADFLGMSETEFHNQTIENTKRLYFKLNK